MEAIRIQPGETIVLPTIWTHDTDNVPAPIDADYNSATGLPTIAITSGATDESGNFTVSVAAVTDTSTGQTLYGYDITLTAKANAPVMTATVKAGLQVTNQATSVTNVGIVDVAVVQAGGTLANGTVGTALGSTGAWVGFTCPTSGITGVMPTTGLITLNGAQQKFTAVIVGGTATIEFATPIATEPSGAWAVFPQVYTANPATINQITSKSSTIFAK